MPRTSLDAVRMQRASQRDRERAALAKLLGEDHRMGQQLSELAADQQQQLAEVAELSRSGRIDVRAAAARRYHATHLRREAFLLTAAREELAKEIAEQRHRLAQADAAVKAVENLIEKREHEAAVEAAKRQQLQLEDEWAAGQAAHT